MFADLPLRLPPTVFHPLFGLSLLGVLLFVGGCAESDLSSEGEAPPAAAVPEDASSRASSDVLIALREETTASGLTFVHERGLAGEALLPETMGGGVAFVDLDGRRGADLLFVDSARWPWDARPPSGGTPRFYANRGDGTFDDRTVATGLADLIPTGSFYGMGPAVGDVDADGDLDVFLTGVGGHRLLENRLAETGRWHDATPGSGLGAGEGWSTGAAFADLDGDGWLDLIVCRYVEWSRALDLEIDFDPRSGRRSYSPPFSFTGAFLALYRNLGDGTFRDVSAEAGLEIVDLRGAPAAKALAVLPIDTDDDGDLDLMVANDTTPNFLLRNDGRGRFEEVGVEVGVAYAPGGTDTGAMGMDAMRTPARGSRAGPLHVAIGNFQDEALSFLVARGAEGVFDDVALRVGLVLPTTPTLTFGLLLSDLDLDGDAELLLANGHIEDDIAELDPGQTFAQPAQLFRPTAPSDRRMAAGSTVYAEVPAADLGAFAIPRVSRGLAAADADLDGDLDLVMTTLGGPPAYFVNDQPTGHHWLRLRLRGPAPNLDAIGARVTVVADGRAHARTVMPARSYLSALELPLVFGLGKATAIERLEVLWPDGARRVIEGDEAAEITLDRAYVLSPDDLVPVAAASGAASGEKVSGARERLGDG
ncbi:MAG: CRTAC1 family protein [Acidobacteriota bacterium]